MTHPIYVRIAPELRRRAIYGIIGLILLAAVATSVNLWLAQRTTFEVIFVAGVFLMAALALFIPVRWTLGLNDEGLLRRRLWRWDMWQWRDFASGRIEKQFAYRFVDPARSRWTRRLCLDFLTDADRRFVLD